MNDEQRYLEKYGQHLPFCPKWVSFGTIDKCTCGFHAALGHECAECKHYGSNNDWPTQRDLERAAAYGKAPRYEDKDKS